METPAVLRDIPVFKGLTDVQLATVAAVLKRTRVRSGKVIIREGDRAGSLYVLTSGSVGTSRRMGLAAQGPDQPEKRKVLVHLSAPQFFGEMGLLTELERSASITADVECELLEFTREDFERLAAGDAALGYRLVRNIAVVLAERLRRTDVDMVKLTTALSLALGNR
jgi:CRP/FNR family transcriptional regulator, cyclic AMP receptor protein